MSIVPSSIAELAKTFKEVGIFLLLVLFFALVSSLRYCRCCSDGDHVRMKTAKKDMEGRVEVCGKQGWEQRLP